MQAPQPLAAPTHAGGDRLRVSIDNHGVIRDVFGPDAAAALATELARRLTQQFGDAALDAQVRPGGHGIDLRLAARPGRPALVDRLLRALAGEPVVVAGTPLLAAVSLSATDAPGRSSAHPLPVATSPAQVRADMAVAVDTYEAVRDGRLYFMFQSITGASAGQSLYQECFPRIVDRTTEDEMLTPRGFIPALERLGLTRRFDRAVIDGGSTS